MKLGNELDRDLLSAIIETSSEAIWVLDLEKNRTYWLASQANEKRYSLPHGSNLSFWTDHLHPDEREKVVEGFQTALRNPSVSSYQHQYRFNVGEGYCLIDDRMRFLRDADGRALRVVGVWNDITEKKYREEKLARLLTELEEERDQFRIVSELSGAALWRVELDTGHIRWMAGPRTLEAFGLTKSPYTVADWTSAIDAADRERVVRHFDDAIENGAHHYQEEYWFTKADGSRARMVDHGYVVRGPDGQPLRVLGGWIDVTQEFNREEALRKLLDAQQRLNETLLAREEELTSSEEELRQINEQLSNNNRMLSEREFLLVASHRLARIGSWEYHPETNQFKWSKELFEILSLDESFPIDNEDEVAKLFEGGDRALVKNLVSQIRKQAGLPFDVVLGVRIPLGYRKWLRISGDVLHANGSSRVMGLVYDVTLFKESEERLRLSENKFQRLFNSNPDLMTLSLEDTFEVVEVNDRVTEVLGFAREETIGKTTVQLGLYVDEAQRGDYLRQYQLEGCAQMECWWRRKGGEPVFVSLNSVRIELDGKRHMLSVIKDITQQRLAEERFRKGFELSPDLMLIFRERDKVLVEANSKLETLSYYKREDVIGRRADEFRLWINPEERAHHLAEYLEKGQAFQEALLRKNGGEVFYGAVSSIRIPLAGEHHMLVVVRDITDRKIAETQLQASEANLNATINNTRLMVWSVDRQYRIITANDPFKSYVKQRYQLEVQPGRRLLPDQVDDPALQDLQERWRVRYERALNGEQIKLEDDRGGRYYEYSLSPIVDRGLVVGASVFAEDITERKQREAALAEANKQIGELRLMALRSVMNPHFVFNALNSIQYFIAKNDRKNAINYMSTFSKLIRGILSHSVAPRIRLADELEMLRYYIDLELLRFENKFEYQVNVQPGVDAESIEVPSLLIQPYVENAILHGLYNKEGRGKLTIEVREEEETVLFSITDNGIGRDAARALRERNFPGHRSMGSVLTEERLKLINREDQVSLQIEDLWNEDGGSAGTRVKIRVRIYF
jgi:PAS domain S-box-containing protein